MPELPEVTTTVNGLKKTVVGFVISDIWSDLPKENPIKQFKETIKDEKFFKKFKKIVAGKRIISVERRAKNILINLSDNQTILIHLKMTGHLLFGKYIYNKKEKRWFPDKNERLSLKDPYNRFIHFVITFSNNKHLVFCDSRKFGKVTLFDTSLIHESNHLKNIGPEPLNKDFTFTKYKSCLLTKPNGFIKTVLINQEIIAGIGNIYSDEMLWLSGIHPESKPKNIPIKQLELLYKSMKKVLNNGIDFGGDSMSDYRNIDGEMGKFQNQHNVYQKNGEGCGKQNCSGVIIRKVINGRSAHYCNKHQKYAKENK